MRLESYVGEHGGRECVGKALGHLPEWGAWSWILKQLAKCVCKKGRGDSARGDSRMAWQVQLGVAEA